MEKRKNDFTPDEIQDKIKEEFKEKMKKSIASTKKLSDYFKEETEGEVKLPKITLNTIALIEEMYGSLDEALGGGKVSNLGGVLWAICNANNDDVWIWTDEQKKASIRIFQSEIDLENLDAYVAAIEKAFGVADQNPS